MHDSHILVSKLGKVPVVHLSVQIPLSLNVGISHLTLIVDELIQPPNPLSLKLSGHFPNKQAPFI